MLNSDYLIDPVAEASELLASVMKLVLTHIVINECFKLKLPLLISRWESLYDLDLLFCPLVFGPTAYHSVLVTLHINTVRTLLFLIVKIERHLPNASV